MCGICGFIVDTNKITNTFDFQPTLSLMMRQIAHRGNDQSGMHLECIDEIQVAVGHQRLSIIDLSEMGKQPLFNETSTICIVFNGEMYNFKELNERLIKNGHTFRSKTDTETIIHLYEDHGTHLFDTMSGMFAFALWDSRTKNLLLGRDPLGIKPLYYTVINNNGIAFASELKSLTVLPHCNKELNYSKIDHYITYGYIPGPETIFKHIYSLPPGHFLQWHNGIIEIQQYWSAETKNTAEMHKGSLDSLAEEYETLLRDSVKSYLIADVDIGAFLSGGIDSSLVCAIARQMVSKSFHTFTIGFSGGGDERAYSRAVANHIGSMHHEKSIDLDLCSQLPKLLWHLDQPLFDNSILPTYLVSQFAKEHTKVVLSGDGGDEPFVGYGWTRAAISLPSIPLPSISSRNWQWNYRTGALGLIQRAFFDVTHTATDRYLRRITTYKNFRHWLYTQHFANQLYSDSQELLRNTINGYSVRNWKERYVLADLLMYLPEDVLLKVDRMSMAHGLEVRVPLLDYKLIEWSLRLPFEFRTRKGIGKILLRHVAKKYLPELVLKPRKQGFTIPIGKWLHGDLGLLAKKIFTSHEFVSRNIIQPQHACALLSMHKSKQYELGHRIWSLIVLEIWCRIWIDGQSPDQTIIQLLHETGSKL